MIKRHKIKNPRHFLNHSEILTNHSEVLKDVFLQLKAGDNLSLKTTKEFLWSPMISAIMSNQPKELVYTIMKHYLDFGVSHFKQYFTNQDEIKVRLGNEAYKVEKIDTAAGINCHSWAKLFSIALILRNEKRQHELLELADKISEKNEFLSQWLEYFKIEFKPTESNNIDFLKLRIEKSKRDIGVFKELDRIRKAMLEGRPKSIGMNSLSLISLYELVSMNDQAAFNELLNIHLEDKKQFIIKNKRHGHPDLWIDFEVLACCSYAYDKNIKISIQSEYIPSWVYEEKWSEFSMFK